METKDEDKRIINKTLSLLSESYWMLLESKDNRVICLAYMIDSALKYAAIIYNDEDVLLAAADYPDFENKMYSKCRKNLIII